MNYPRHLFVVALLGMLCSNGRGQIVTNGSFETPTVVNYSYANALGFSIPGWTLFGNSGLIYPPSGFSAPAAVEGSQIAFLQTPSGSISQTISLPTNGLYTLAYYVAGRPGGGNVTYNIFLDSSILVSNATTTSGQAFTLQSVSFTNTAGGHVLVFTNSTTSGDNTAFFDFVQVNGGTNIVSITPTNTTCGSSVLLAGGIVYSMNTTTVPTASGMVDSCGVNLSHGVWYKLTPGINERVKINTAGSSFPTGLSVYTGTCNALTNVQCSLPAYYGGNGNASVDFSSASNVTYYILAGGVNGLSGNLVITATLTNPPANDLCTGAIDLTVINTNSESIINATEPDATDSCGVNLSHGVWYKLTPGINERVKINTAGSSFPTGLSVYTGTCNALTNVQCSLPAYYGGNGNASVDFSSASNVTYYILAGGVNGLSGNLVITATLTNPPANDLCTGAIDLTVINTNSESIINATEPDATDSCGVNLSHGVWYKLTPGINERVKINTAGSSFPTGLSVYTGTCNALTNVQCSLPAYYGGNGNASVDFSSASNVTYYILAGGVNGLSGNLVITATLTNPPANDTCANPVALTNGIPYVMDTSYATEISDTNVGCGAGIGHGVWFSLAAFSGQPITISTCGSTYGTDLLIYTNACGFPGNPVSCSSGSNPFNCAGNLAGVSFIAPTNLTYYILAAGVGSESGTLKITANQSPPTNDVCAYAIPMTNGVTYTITNIFATSIGDPVPSCVPTFGRGVWYSYTPSTTGPVGVTTCGSSFQTALAVYTGACGSWNEIACSKTSGAYCNSGNADVNFLGTNGVTYYILAGGVNGAAGTLQIQIPIVDLVSVGLSASNSAGGVIIAGKNMNASWTVQNQGSSSINGTWTDSLSLSNAVTNVVLRAFNSHGPASASGSYPEGGNNILVPPIPPGHYSLIAMADSGNAVSETNKANNVATALVDVTNIIPTVTLLVPTNVISRESCVPLRFNLAADVKPGSYVLTNVFFFNGSMNNIIGRLTNGQHSTSSLALDIGTNTIGVAASDSYGYLGVSTNTATVILYYPTNLYVIRTDLATNGDFVGCMCALSGSNYLVLTSTNLANPTAWQPYVTNQAFNNLAAFTNHPTDPVRVFRMRQLP